MLLLNVRHRCSHYQNITARDRWKLLRVFLEASAIAVFAQPPALAHLLLSLRAMVLIRHIPLGLVLQLSEAPAMTGFFQSTRLCRR